MTSPRRLVHRGCVDADALIVDPQLLGAERAQRRICASWSDGTRVSAMADGRWLVRWPSPQRFRADEAPGHLLVAGASGLQSAPLRDSETDAAPPGPLLLVAGGELTAGDFGAAVDPAGWVDVGTWDVVDVTDLGAAPSAVALVVDEVQQAPEELLGSDAPLAADRMAATRAIVDALQREESGDYGPAGEPGAALAGLDRVGAEALASGGSVWARMSRWFKRRLFARAIGRQHARYLQKMLEYFDEGDLDEALRHAIPLSGNEPSGGADGFPGRLGPRDSLRIRPTGGISGYTLGVGASLFELLQQRYERALSRLKAQQRWREAAYVLTELLNRPEAAVALLEEHELYREAAELAETRALDPALIVRLWLRAGKTRRAIKLAHRHDAFGALLRWLDEEGHALAPYIRWVFARSLLERGALAAAVETAWPLEERREEVQAWMTQHLAAGDILAARLVPRLLRLAPDAYPQVSASVKRVLQADDLPGQRLRDTLATALVADPDAPGLPRLARHLSRALLRDGTAEARRRLDAMCGRPELGLGDMRADVASLARPLEAKLQGREGVLELTMRTEPGSEPIRDAALLPDGRVLLALGDAGVRLTDSTGRCHATWDTPAHSMVVADSGVVALAVAHRGPFLVIAKLDLISFGRTTLGAHFLDGVASTWDGARLFAWQGDSVSLLDTQSDRLDALWRVGDLGGRVGTLSREPGHVAFGVWDPKRCEIWSYDEASLRLQSRREVLAWEPDPQDDGTFSISGLAAVTPDGHGLVTQHPHSVALTRREGRWELRAGTFFSARGELDIGSCTAAVNRDWIAAYSDSGTLWLLTHEMIPRARLQLGMAGGYRLDQESLTAFDNEGRVLAVDLRTGATRVDLQL